MKLSILQFMKRYKQIIKFMTKLWKLFRIL